MARKETSSNLTIKTPEQNPVDIQDDEYRGMGGSYIVDPATGKRTRIEEPATGTNTNVGTDHIRPADVTETEKYDEI